MKVFGHIRCGNRARIAAVVLAMLCLAAGTVAEAQTNNTSNAATNNSTAVLTNSAAVAETNSAASVQTNTAAVAQTNTPSATQTNGAPAETKTETTATESKPEKEYNNWVEFGLGNFFVSGDKGSFQQRHQNSAGTFGGVESFHVEAPIKKDAILTLDGRGIFDEHNYDVALGLAHPNIGYVRGGYKEFRTYYDGSGGFFPPNGQWFNLYNDELKLDRGEAWVEAGLTLPNVPLLTFRYSHEFRNGQKDSTIWGDTGLTGGFGQRAIVPSFYDIDEKRDIFELDAKHTIGKTDFGVGGRVDLLDQNNSRNMRRRPGETGTTVAGPNTSIDRFVTQRDGVDADLFSTHAFADTRFNDKVRFSVGGSFTSLETDISGSRVYGPDYDSVYDPTFVRRQERDSGFVNLGGGADWKQYVGNLNLMATPWEHVDLVPSVRIENTHQDGSSHFTSTDVLGAPTFTSTQADLVNEQERRYTDVSEALELRYTGITNWAFYTRGEWLEGQDTVHESQTDIDAPPPGTKINRETDTGRFTQKYVLGINWYPLRRLNTALQYYHKQRNNNYEHEVDSTSNATNSGDRYPAFIDTQDFKTDDVNFRVTWRPWTFLTSISRYDFQLSTIDMRAAHLDEVQSGELVSHIFSQSFTIVPWNPMYVQLNGTYVFDQTDSPADFQPGAAANLVTKSRNGFWTLDATVGLSLDERTDLQAQYSYYESDDFSNNSTVSTPYGNSSHEHGVTVGLNRKITPRLRWSLKYGYFDYKDETSGGHNNYSAHMVYSSVQYRF